jgi:sn-glycerol 3-phosphate transport system substrate-binding protein
MMNTGTPEQKDAAWQLMKHLFSTANLAKYAIASGYMASRRSSFNSDIMQKQFSSDPRYRVSYLQVDSSAPRDGTHVPFWSQVQDEIQKVGTVMFRENGNVKAALDGAVDVSNAMLKEYFVKSGRKSLYDR